MTCTVAVALVLLLDASASIRDADWRAQVDGHAAALRDPAIARIVERDGGLALLALAFSDTTTPMVPWRVIRNGEQLHAAAQALAEGPRGIPSGTAMGEAVFDALRALAQAPCVADVEIVDLVTDGEANTDPMLRARGYAEAQGVKINALAVGPPQAEAWLRQFAVTPGGFVMRAAAWGDFAEVMRRKLVLELAAR